MKVILLQDIRGVGKKYDIKDIADGHARNALIPHGKAEVATPDALKRVEAIKAQRAAEDKIQDDLLAKSMATISQQVLHIKERVNEKGHLFAALHPADIAKKLEAQTNIALNPSMIILDKPLKEVGEHAIPVQSGNKKTTLKVVVEAA